LSEAASPPLTTAPGPRWSGWWRLFAIVLVLFSALLSRSCEVYTAEYQDLPVVAWVEAQPPFNESLDLPPAREIAYGFVQAIPHLRVTGSPTLYLPSFTLPGAVVRSVGGVRDAARVVKESPDPSTRADYASVDVYVTVFNRTFRSDSWARLRTIQMDLSHNESQIRRVTGPSERDTMWVVEPFVAEDPKGAAIIVGHRGPIGFEIRSQSIRPLDNDRQMAGELTARAEELVQRAADEWTTWLEAQPYWRKEWAV
jgi:hypothetical protein